MDATLITLLLIVHALAWCHPVALVQDMCADRRVTRMRVCILLALISALGFATYINFRSINWSAAWQTLTS